VLQHRLSPALSICLLLASCSAFKSEGQYVARGNQFLDQGKLADALINLRKALQKNPQSGDAYYGLGRIQILQDQPAEAIHSLIQAHRLLKGREDVVATFANLCIGLSARSPGTKQATLQSTAEPSAGFRRRSKTGVSERTSGRISCSCRPRSRSSPRSISARGPNPARPTRDSIRALASVASKPAR
jgi:tetratricopeptide (TPR) repeat protein